MDEKSAFREEKLAVVSDAAEALASAWKADGFKGRKRKQAVARLAETFGRVEALFPGVRGTAERVFEAYLTPCTVRDAEAILADLERTGPFPVEHPLLERLWAAGGPDIEQVPPTDRVIRARLGPVGLILDGPPRRHSGYDNTPLNAVCFASTGGDGDHYSLIPIDGTITAQSPVVLSFPSEEEPVFVGENLKQFLCAGLHWGYFDFFANLEDEQSETAGWWFGEEVDAQQQEFLRSLAEELDLEPIPPATVDPDELWAKFSPLLENRSDAML
ncbi:hypothetical protein [Stratiformator vulcanicus]|uniref:Uncharacterized protein n=1 Tax=Stratiformator vulcanicus TaxID=2527980 RepID=A0A517R7C7_9PLAN|nr:hypothetical protein [Stratiformator vulcanicus]QDT39775.1 hypothetical protein Pan189_41860 [Stratiformator vulcanicus]